MSVKIVESATAGAPYGYALSACGIHPIHAWCSSLTVRREIASTLGHPKMSAVRDDPTVFEQEDPVGAFANAIVIEHADYTPYARLGPMFTTNSRRQRSRVEYRSLIVWHRSRRRSPELTGALREVDHLGRRVDSKECCVTPGLGEM